MMAPSSQMSAAGAPPACPKCSGLMWDNRIGKRNPKSPDFKCRDRGCDGVVWKAPKEIGVAGASALKTPAAREPTGAKPVSAAAPRSAAPASDSRIPEPSSLCATYLACLDFAIQHVAPRLTAAGVTVSAENLLNSATTCFIAKTRDGGNRR